MKTYSRVIFVCICLGSDTSFKSLKGVWQERKVQRGSQNIAMLKVCSFKKFVRTIASVALNTDNPPEWKVSYAILRQAGLRRKFLLGFFLAGENYSFRSNVKPKLLVGRVVVCTWPVMKLFIREGGWAKTEFLNLHCDCQLPSWWTNRQRGRKRPGQGASLSAPKKRPACD